MSTEESSNRNFSFLSFLPVILTWTAIISQIVLTFVLWDNYYNLDFLVYIGYTLWILGALFGILPIIILRRRGAVSKGDSYIKTTKLVTSGLYAIVRHPQYLAAIIISFALAFMSQHLVVTLLVLPPIICTYIDTLNEDKSLLSKFGTEYRLYMKQVPRLEPITGIIRLIFRMIKNRSKKSQ